MNVLKRILGLFWILLGRSVIILMSAQAIEKIGIAPEGAVKTNTTLQWGIILLIFIPISTGLVIFGYYALKGEYDRLPPED